MDLGQDYVVHWRWCLLRLEPSVWSMECQQLESEELVTIEDIAPFPGATHRRPQYDTHHRNVARFLDTFQISEH